MARYPGACHCGTIRFEVEAEPVEMTTCDCSLCARRNAVMIKVPQDALRLLAGEAQLATYVWNTGVARHHFCSRCGIYVFHRKRAAPDSFGVNVFCLDGFDPTALPVRATDGAGMSLQEPRP
ncbi:MAG: hypothetical protein K0R83_1585 [Caulobacter sp.]|jgi:hypothetical protein|nr:hypothetical protein [Caulobacter sp.]